jgi:hypothetical protein
MSDLEKYSFLREIASLSVKGSRFWLMIITLSGE